MKINLKTIDSVLDKEVGTSCFFKQVLVTIASCLTSLCSGHTMGITAVMLPQLREDMTIQYDPSEESWIAYKTITPFVRHYGAFATGCVPSVYRTRRSRKDRIMINNITVTKASIAVLSMIIGSLSSAQMLDSYGRKASLLICIIIIIIGWILMACANSISLILLGRVITGLGSGISKAVALVYIGEVADPEFRKTALLYPTIAAQLGGLTSHIIGHYLNWRVSSIIYVVPALLSSIIMLFIKESPLWLITKGRKEEGIKCFQWYRGTDEASEMELRIFLERHTGKPKMSLRETFKAVCSMYFIKPMLILMVLVLNVQFSGLVVIVFYSQDIFERTFSGKASAFVIMVVMDCIRCSVSMSNSFIIARFPKKITFITSNFGVTVFVFGLVTCFMMKFEIVWLQIFLMVMYIGCSSLIGTVGWTYVPELLPSNARGFGAGLNSAFGFLTLFFVTKFTPDFMHAYGESALFGFYGVSTLICGLILSFLLPETNGKTLQCIEDGYNKNNVEQTHL